ncbi:YdbH domain-containing protein [Marinobacter sp.]|uniref:YdbH domain-containing protein n=1 Tax=Marinobacter sp. TaxID=50741 RepID=UPI0019E79C5F|nr:YdbH domain-containing protein [Marinobacter sp.]MBE0487120.1 YdbH domain-containing protein [Marinobacter sp.]
MSDRVISMAYKPWTRNVFLLACLLLAQPTFAIGWSLILQQGQIGLALPDVQSGDWRATGIRTDMVTSVEADERKIIVHFKPGSRLQAARVIHDRSGVATELDNVQVDLSDATLTVNLSGTGTVINRSALAGNLTIAIGEVRHPGIRPQSWHFEGRIDGAWADLNIDGQLRSDSGLLANVTLRNVPEKFLMARVTLAMAAEQISKTLATTLSDWPELLELNAGQLRVDATLRLEADSPLALEARVDADSVSGLMDRTALSGLTGRLLINLEDDALVARFRDVTIAQINSGIGIGPIRFLADYRANQSDLFAGILDIQQANASFLDGRLRVAPGAIDLATEPWLLPIDVHEVSLDRLLQVYPAEGFSGSGELSGRVPVMVSASGLSVEQGKLAAVAPGGMLLLPAERLQTMLGRSQAMELVVQALQNFHYSVLDSTIDYDKDGRLVLGLRLEGQNPDIKGGQPVVLNINLEEDIPALLTSLQLSGRVNEAVTERVRERLEQSGQEIMP